MAARPTAGRSVVASKTSLARGVRDTSSASLQSSENREPGRPLMPKPITPDVVVAYSHCPRKAYLLLCTEEHGIPHEYQRIVAADQRRNQASFLNGLTQEHGDNLDCRGTDFLPSPGHRSAAVLKTPDCEAYCDRLAWMVGGGVVH
jgi:hypothetical protein